MVWPRFVLGGLGVLHFTENHLTEIHFIQKIPENHIIEISLHRKKIISPKINSPKFI